MIAMRFQPNPDFLRRLGVVFAAAMALAVFTPVSAQMGPLEDLAAFPSGKLEIGDGKKVKHTFDV